ncbi:MAG: hypothetical protein IJC14_01625, partial [Firmicutes bacterium]|nr:hypothetical protein [Bacillota bacterium]
KTTTNNWNAEGEGPHYGLTSTTSGSYNKNSADITITNHSNAGINFTAALAGDIDAYLTLSKTSGSILSDAVGAAEDPCPFDKITVSTKATEPSANVNGTITVTISE